MVMADVHMIHKKEEKKKEAAYRKSTIYANEIGKKSLTYNFIQYGYHCK